MKTSKAQAHPYPAAAIEADRLLVVSAALLLIALAGYLYWTQRSAGSALAYSPAEVVYGQSLHAGPGMMGEGMRPAGFASSALEDPTPRLELPSEVLDLGVVRAGEVVTRQIPLANRGDAPLKIASAHTTCGCTSADISAVEIPPGKVALVTVRFDAGYHDLRGQTVRRGLMIQTNDPRLPWAELWLQATVR